MIESDKGAIITYCFISRLSQHDYVTILPIIIWHITQYYSRCQCIQSSGKHNCYNKIRIFNWCQIWFSISCKPVPNTIITYVYFIFSIFMPISLINFYRSLTYMCIQLLLNLIYFYRSITQLPNKQFKIHTFQGNKFFDIKHNNAWSAYIIITSTLILIFLTNQSFIFSIFVLSPNLIYFYGSITRLP